MAVRVMPTSIAVRRAAVKRGSGSGPSLPSSPAFGHHRPMRFVLTALLTISSSRISSGSFLGLRGTLTQLGVTTAGAGGGDGRLSGTPRRAR